MLRVSLIGTGSSGNSCIFDNGETKLVIDMGLKAKIWQERANKVGYKYEDLDAILITHAHGDHVATSFNSYIGKCGMSKIFTTPVVANDISRKKMATRYKLEDQKTLPFKEPTLIGSFEVMPIMMVHYGLGKSRVNQCVGYQLYDRVNKKLILYASDTNTLKHVQVPEEGYDLLMLEDNHDAERAWETFQLSSQSIADAALYKRTKDHMSTQDLAAWLLMNNIKDAPFVPLHESSRNKKYGTLKLKEGQYYNTYWEE